jgi:S-adenosylmethionine:tRNA ribosyltransferase-isomerase
MPGDFYYDLPPELIAQAPVSPRDHSRLLTIDRKTGALDHYHFYELPKLLRPDDVLVFNQTKVIPARLYGTKPTGGKVEILLLRNTGNDIWEIISHPGLKPGQIVNFSSKLFASVKSPNTLQLSSNNYQLLTKLGHTPLPPYIHSTKKESILRRQYQTVYANKAGSAAAPTAGLHFTQKLLARLPQQKEYLTLHVGLGTFKSPTPAQIKSKTLHHEYYELSKEVASRLKKAKSSGRRIIAVGTTTARVLETTNLKPQSGETNLFIQPGYKFKVIDGLITNFHLPGSSLIMLVSAFSSWPIIKNAYETAISQNYRFFSFGDACLIC